MKRYLVDVNVWVALAYQGHAQYGRAVRWYEELENEAAVCCRLSQIGLLRALTNASIMGAEVCSIQNAWRAYGQLESDVRFAFMDEPDGLDDAFRHMSSLPIPAPRVWTDAYFAAFSNAADIGLATFDAGFATRGGVQDLTIIE